MDDRFFYFFRLPDGRRNTIWVTNIQDLGHTAAMAALAGAVIAPFKTVGQFFEMLVSRSMYPLVTYALSLGLMFSGFVVLLIFGFTLTGLLLAAALYGMGDRIKTITRGTLPLALFGPKGRVHDLGRSPSYKWGSTLPPLLLFMDHANLRRLVVFCCHSPVSLLCHRYLNVYSRPKETQE